MEIVIAAASVEFARWGVVRPALINVTLSIPQGATVLISGPNGSGKSTLLNAIAGEVPLIEGSVHLADRLVECQRPPFDLVYFVPQDPMRGTVGSLSVLEHFILAGNGKSQRGAKVRTIAQQLLSRFDIDLALEQRADALSGGQRQILALLLAHQRKTPIVLLDEPTSALDPSRREIAKEIVKDMQSQRRTVIVVSHDDLFGHGTRVFRVALQGGRIAESDLPCDSKRGRMEAQQ